MATRRVGLSLCAVLNSSRSHREDEHGAAKQPTALLEVWWDGMEESGTSGKGDVPSAPSPWSAERRTQQ